MPSPPAAASGPLWTQYACIVEHHLKAGVVEISHAEAGCLWIGGTPGVHLQYPVGLLSPHDVKQSTLQQDLLDIINVHGLTQMQKQVATELAPVVQAIFTQSLHTSKLHEDWRNVFKKGNRHLAESYRPISLTGVCCKLMEHITCRNILQHIERTHYSPHFNMVFPVDLAGKPNY